MNRNRVLLSVLTLVLALAGFASANAQTKKPNILIIWGDDIGVWNISAYNQGMMGYKTPNIDRIAKEVALFTDAYAQNSCTADTWVVTPMLKIVGEFNATTQDNPLIPMGTPDPYTPPSAKKNESTQKGTQP